MDIRSTMCAFASRWSEARRVGVCGWVMTYAIGGGLFLLDGVEIGSYRAVPRLCKLS